MVQQGSAGFGGGEDARWPDGQEEIFEDPPGCAVVTQKPQICGLTQGLTTLNPLADLVFAGGGMHAEGFK